MTNQQDTPSVFNFISWWKNDPIKAALISGLGFLSWLATYTGMVELIAANTGYITFEIRIALGFAVAMLMLMILYLLESLFSPDTPRWLKPLFVVGYVFLTLISVGFGFGFYWKYLESRSEATRSAESAITQVQRSLQVGQTRMEQLLSTFTKLTEISTKKAKVEREQGGTCGHSRPGDGPRRRLRDNDAQQFDFASNFIKDRVGVVQKDLEALNDDIKKVLSGDSSTIDKRTGTRNRFLNDLGRKLGLTISRFNAVRTDPQLIQIRDSLKERSQKVTFPTGRGRRTFRCPDGQLQAALTGAVRAINEMHVIKDVQISAVEGAEAIVEAFRRLAVTVIALPTFKLPPGPDEIRAMRKQIVSTGSKVQAPSEAEAGLGQRDYIPLFVAIFVDLCILLVSLNRRVNQLAKIRSQMEDAREGRFHEILTKIEKYQKNEEGRHFGQYSTGRRGINLLNQVIVDRNGEYFAAIPIDGRNQDSRFLTNLFLGLEGIGIVKRTNWALNFLTKVGGLGIEQILERQGSQLVAKLKEDAPGNKLVFRTYRFHKNILANVMLDAIHGTAQQVSVIARADALHRQEFLNTTRAKLNQLSSRLLAIHMDIDKKQRAQVKANRDRADKLLQEQSDQQVHRDALRVGEGVSRHATAPGNVTRGEAEHGGGENHLGGLSGMERVAAAASTVSLPELKRNIANTNDSVENEEEAATVNASAYKPANLSRVTAGIRNRQERHHALGNVINGFSHKSSSVNTVLPNSNRKSANTHAPEHGHNRTSGILNGKERVATSSGSIAKSVSAHLNGQNNGHGGNFGNVSEKQNENIRDDVQQKIPSESATIDKMLNDLKKQPETEAVTAVEEQPAPQLNPTASTPNETPAPDTVVSLQNEGVIGGTGSADDSFRSQTPTGSKDLRDIITDTVLESEVETTETNALSQDVRVGLQDRLENVEVTKTKEGTGRGEGVPNHITHKVEPPLTSLMEANEQTETDTLGNGMDAVTEKIEEEIMTRKIAEKFSPKKTD